MQSPPITATVLRYAWPLTVTATGGRRPAASSSIAAGGTIMPIFPPSPTRVVLKLVDDIASVYVVHRR